jgi:hypothetical protein
MSYPAESLFLGAFDRDGAVGGNLFVPHCPHQLKVPPLWPNLQDECHDPLVASVFLLRIIVML